MDFAALLRTERARARQNLTSTLPTSTPSPPSVAPSVASLEACHKEHVDEKTKHLIFELDSTPTLHSLQISSSSPHVQGIRYYANFLTHEDARALHFAVNACKDDRWITLPTTGRRLQQWGGMPGARNHLEKGAKKKEKKEKKSFFNSWKRGLEHVLTFLSLFSCFYLFFSFLSSQVPFHFQRTKRCCVVVSLTWASLIQMNHRRIMVRVLFFMFRADFEWYNFLFVLTSYFFFFLISCTFGVL